MTIDELLCAIEACLFASGEPVSVQKLSLAVDADDKTVLNAISLLNDRYIDRQSALEIIKLDDSFQLCTRKETAPYVKKLLEIRRNTPLSQSALETLAIIAYNQPVTKSFIDQVRGVDSYYAVSSLCEKGLVQEAERLNIPGRPMTFVTTPHFLRSFAMSSLEELIPPGQLVDTFTEPLTEETEE